MAGLLTHCDRGTRLDDRVTGLTLPIRSARTRGVIERSMKQGPQPEASARRSATRITRCRTARFRCRPKSTIPEVGLARQTKARPDAQLTSGLGDAAQWARCAVKPAVHPERD